MNTGHLIPKTTPMIAVAIAVIRYHDEFLVATRHAHQHEGGKLEFVGGKVRQGELAEHALIREVAEEIGLQLKTDQLVRFGIIAHDYADTSVELSVYQVNLNYDQYQAFRHRAYGCEQQTLHWLGIKELLTSANRLPAANLRILDWLNIPKQIVISHSLAHFGTLNDFAQYYIKNLPNNAGFYLRPQADLAEAKGLYHAIRGVRHDIAMIIKDDLYLAYGDAFDDTMMVKLSAETLAKLVDNQNQITDFIEYFPKDLPIFVGVHDAHEVQLVNALSHHARIIGACVSPIKATQSHPSVQALGWQSFGELARMLCVPAIALGGLKVTDMAIASRQGAVAIGGIRGML